MKILHAVAPAAFGGVERVVHALAVGHHRAGHVVRVAVIDTHGRSDATFSKSLREAGIEVESAPIPSRRYLQERSFIAKLCTRFCPDLLHTHGYRVDVVDSGRARKLRIPTVSTAHGFTGGGPKNRLYEWLQRRAWQRFDAVVAVSRPLAAELTRDGISPERLHMLPNAWSDAATLSSRTAARRELAIADGCFHVGWVGRLGREKGPDVFIDAVARLVELPLTASVLGDGRQRADLRVQATKLNIGERIRWHGAVPNANRVFPAFDAFVLSSRSEGTPIVLFEAMAAGVPIVATRVGGVPDVVSTKEAILVEPEDPGALADAIREIYQNPKHAADRARSARERLENDFGLEPWLARYEEIYRHIIPER